MPAPRDQVAADHEEPGHGPAPERESAEERLFPEPAEHPGVRHDDRAREDESQNV